MNSSPFTPPTFNNELRKLVNARLSAWNHESFADTALKRAAVNVVLLDDGQGKAAMLLTRRTSKLKNHGGQYALPGGRIDVGETGVQAALREMHEEIGVALTPASILGRLDDYPTRSGYLITPFVVWAGGDIEIVPNPDEVAKIYRIPLSELAKPDSPQFVSIPESDRPVIRYPLLGTLIHAPTAAVMYQFMEVAIFDRPTRVAHLEQAVFAWR